MSNRIIFSEAEIATPADFTAIGEAAQGAQDAISGGALGWPAHWARFTVASSESDTVTLTAGEMHEGEKVFAADEAIDVSLQSFKPIISSDERWVALILRGAEETANVIRAFETSEEPLTESTPVNQSTPKEARRVIEVVIQQGEIAPPPANRPTVAEHDCCVAFVRLTTEGIQEIVANESDRVKTVFEIEGRLVVVEARVNRLFQETEAIATDLSSVAARVAKLDNVRPLLKQVTRDVARTRQLLNFPEEARNYYFDQGLVPDFWDFGHASSLIRVDEGLRAQYASQAIHPLRVLDLTDPKTEIYDNRLVLPAYEETLRIESPLGSGRQDIANTVHTVTTAHRRTVRRTRIRHGETIFPCENTAGWEDIGSRRPGETFRVDGEEFVARGLSDDPWNDAPEAQDGHLNYAVQRVIRDTTRRTYVTYTTEEFGLNGAIYGQTFLCSQLMVATSIDLHFTRVGSTGDVIFALCEINSAGSPEYDAVIARVTKPRAELAVNSWVKFSFEPTLLEPGKRYAWFTVTSGNHQIAQNDGNQFTGGTKFVSSDGVWSQGSTTEDFSFRLYAAKFSRSRTVVPMEPITLDGGMTEIDMIYGGFEPDGTALVWEVKPTGSDEWIPMDARDPNPMANLPPLLQLRAVFIGTQDVAPMLDLSNYSRVKAGRPRNDARAVSNELSLGFTTDGFQIIVNMDNYDPEIHTVEPKLIVDGTVIEPGSVTEIPDPGKATRAMFKADFTLGAVTGAVRLRLDFETSAIIKQAFVQDVQLNAF